MMVNRAVAVKLKDIYHIMLLPTDIRSHVILMSSFSFLITADFGRIDLGTSQSKRRFLVGIFLLTLPFFLKHSLIFKVFDALVI